MNLQDIVFYNEAYSNSCSSGDGSPEFETAKSRCSGDLAQSPQRGQSFLAAVINAIRNATSSTAKIQSNNKQQQKPIEAGTPGDGKLLTSLIHYTFVLICIQLQMNPNPQKC